MAQEKDNPDDDAACPAPTTKHDQLQQWDARDTAIAERRSEALEDITARVEATKDLQQKYEEARNAQMPVLRELLEQLKAIKKAVDCQVPPDYREKLRRCFCEALDDTDDSVEPPTSLTCDDAENACDEAGLESLLIESTKVSRAIDWLKVRLDELAALPAAIEPMVTQLAADVAELDQALSDKTIEYARAFVINLQLCQRYVELRCELTGSRAFICTIYKGLDRLFDLYEVSICTAGAVARLQKQAELKAASRATAKERLIDDVLICADPGSETSIDDDDTDLKDLWPCGDCAGDKTPVPEVDEDDCDDDETPVPEVDEDDCDDEPEGAGKGSGSDTPEQTDVSRPEVRLD